MSLQVINRNIPNLLKRFGQTIKHYPSRICSCVAENNGMPKLNHTCMYGFYFDEPETVIGIRTQVSYKYLNQPHGRIYNGGATFTIPKFNLQGVEQKAWTKIAHGDILVLDNKTRRDTDILIRGVRDYLFAFDVIEVLSISRNNVKYTAGTDYTVTEGSSVAAGKLTTINWQTGKGPENGDTFTVEFTCKQQFKIWEDGGQDRGTDEDELPKKVVAVLRRFVNPEPQEINTIEPFGKIY